MPKSGVQKLYFIDIFCGAGGLSCGLEMAGLECVLGIDFDRHAIETFAQNHRKAESYCGDIEQLTTAKLKKLTHDRPIHLVVGGPPCQGFSTVGLGDPKDKRNTLFREFVRVVKVTKPSYIIIENVTGLLAQKNEKTLKAIFKQFNQLGYNLDVKVLSAHHYGVPEKRRRTIFIGSRLNSEITFPKHTHDAVVGKSYIPAVTVGDAFADLKTKKGEILNHDLDMAQVKSAIDKKRLHRIPEGKGIRYEKDEKAFLPPRLRLDVDWEKIPENRFRQTKYQRLDRSKTSPTIMTHRHGYYHPTEDRYLTQREGAKIQSFPNNFLFKGPVSAQWRQIGNAVPPLLGKALGLAIKKMYREAKKVNTVERANQNKRKVSQNISIIRGKAFLYSESSKQN